MKLRILGALSLALCVCFASAVEAQQDGQRGQRGQRGQGGPGGPGGGGRGGFGGPGGGSMGGALDLLGLLRMEEVRADVGMEEATYEAVQAAQPSMRELFQIRDEAERTAKLKEMNTKAQETLDEVLAPKQQKRLMGLLVQQRGLMAATNELVAKEIKLDEAGIKKVTEAATKAGEGMREKMREMFQGGNREDMTREKMEEMRASAQKDVDAAIGAVLTAEHKAALEALKGAKFEFPEATGGGRGGAGGGRGGAGGGRGGQGGQGGGRQRGARPGADN
ncbi:hypothetical protein [Aureliella helgolandensis]|uniref:LTXXQ motif protein n=1 Tax=Aureliella helgolandensis TaxID=2527968 RepID=A0A518FZT8_9BACT|nr:hypothetical protein [Aureliella helgolandensis]QDV21878.1 hypothetical protein Q31a_01570 [Aureliella helgolandensis]